jgi:hypothetical protein
MNLPPPKKRPVPAEEKASGTAPEALPSKSFSLGMTREEVIRALGPPRMHFVPRARRYFTAAEYDAALSVYGLVDDVYTRRTQANEYQVRMHYMLDSLKSRLHPETRLGGVTFVIDRPASMPAVLADIPEALSLCAAGCRVIGLTSSVSPEIIVYPENPKPEQLELGRLVATGWKGESSGFNWVLAIRLSWEEAAGAYGRSAAGSRDWMAHPIEEFRFGAADPDHEFEMARRFPNSVRQPVSLGRWKP